MIIYDQLRVIVAWIVQSAPLTHEAKARSGISRGRISWKQATTFCRILLKPICKLSWD